MSWSKTRVLASGVTPLNHADPQDEDFIRHWGAVYFQRAFHHKPHILRQTQGMFEQLMTTHRQVKNEPLQRKVHSKLAKETLSTKRSTVKSCEPHGATTCLFPSFRGMLLVGKSPISSNNLLKNTKPIFPGSPQSKMSLSHAAFPEFSILLMWRHGVDVGSMTPRPWSLALVPYKPCGLGRVIGFL